MIRKAPRINEHIHYLLNNILWGEILYDVYNVYIKQEAQGLGPLLDKIEDNDHIKLDNTEI